MSADLRGKNLRAVSWFESSRRGGCANEFAFFGENEQLIACEGDRGCAEIILFPANFAGLEFDATKACGWFQAGIGSAVDAIKQPVVINAGGVVIGENVISGPDFFGTACANLQQDCTEAITGREKDLIINDERSRGGNGR